jgi:prolyl 3-hydroxylase /prolyl 3,4-dihydroxylase
VTTLEYPRITINGWFHQTNFENKDSKLGRTPATNLPSKFTPNASVDLTEWVNECYLKPAVCQKIQQQIEAASEISLDQFLAPEVFDVMLNEFKTNTSLCWKPMGPANLRRYDRLHLDDLRGPIRDLLALFTSSEMFDLLHAYTELDLAGENAQQPLCTLEIQRWQAGCYTVLSDSSYDAADSALDLVVYFNSEENVGKITYLSPEAEEGEKSDSDEEDDEEDGAANLTIEPKDNVLNLVFRSEGTTKFTKYVSKRCQLKAGEYSYLFVCSYKE